MSQQRETTDSRDLRLRLGKPKAATGRSAAAPSAKPEHRSQGASSVSAAEVRQSRDMRLKLSLTKQLHAKGQLNALDYTTMKRKIIQQGITEWMGPRTATPPPKKKVTADLRQRIS